MMAIDSEFNGGRGVKVGDSWDSRSGLTVLLSQSNVLVGVVKQGRRLGDCGQGQNVWTSIKVLSPGCVPQLVGELLKNINTYALLTEVLISCWRWEASLGILKVPR